MAQQREKLGRAPAFRRREKEPQEEPGFAARKPCAVRDIRDDAEGFEFQSHAAPQRTIRRDKHDLRIRLFQRLPHEDRDEASLFAFIARFGEVMPSSASSSGTARRVFSQLSEVSAGRIASEKSALRAESAGGSSPRGVTSSRFTPS